MLNELARNKVSFKYCTMSRVAACLFFIAIFQYGILQSLADESTTVGISKNNNETTAKPTADEPAKDPEVPAKVESEDKSGVTPKTETKVDEVSDVPQKKDDKPNEEKEAVVNESKKEDVTEKTIDSDNRKILPDVLKEVPGNPVDQSKGLFELPKHILAPVNAVGAKVHETVVKGLDTAKGLANGTYSFLRTAINAPFQNMF